MFAIQALVGAFGLRSVKGVLSAGQTVLVLAPVVISVAVGCLLWRFPLGVARILVPRGADKAVGITLREAWRLGSVLIGFIALTSAAPDLIRAILVQVVVVSGTSYEEVTIGMRMLEIAPALAETVLALFLILGNEYIYARFGVAPRPQAEADNTA